MACNRCGTDYTNFDLCGNCKQVGELENRVKELVKVLELADDAFGTPGIISEKTSRSPQGNQGCFEEEVKAIEDVVVKTYIGGKYQGRRVERRMVYQNKNGELYVKFKAGARKVTRIRGRIV